MEHQNEQLRRQQLELQLARDRYFDLYELAPVGYCTLNRKGEIQDANLLIGQLLGVSRSAIKGQLINQFLITEDLPILQRLREQHSQLDGPQSCVLRMRKGDGCAFWVHWASSIEPRAHSEWLWKIVLTSATELQRAQEAQTRLARTLATQIENLNQLTNELTQSEERERQALAQDLHDNFAQWLAAIKINLANLANLAKDDASAFAAPIAKLNALLDHADLRLRSVIYELSPPSLMTLGLAPAWQYLIKLLENSYGLVVVLHDQTDPKLLDEVRRIVVYRCVRELLLNVAKHSGVKRAELSCMVLNDQLVASVSDDGCGWDASQLGHSPPSGRFGLRGMSRRLLAIQGSVEIDSAPGKGCLVVLSVPINEHFPLKVSP